jgi:micrococcal nuclease
MIYHRPGQAYYDITVAEECFATAAQAEAAGYRAAQV